VGRAAAPVAVGLATVVLAGCTVLSPPDPRLCSAAQNLSAAMALTATAIAADDAGDLAQAQGLATQARSLAELADSTLTGMPDDRKADPVWQALQMVYLGTGQAANSLLPAYSNSHGIGPAQMASAESAMGRARAGLPAMCFAIPADLETPRPS
jgi:hypothetical protein